MSKFFFVCACGCGQTSDSLGKDYMRLTRGNKWYAKGCAPKDAQTKEFKGGSIVREEDF